MNLRKFVFFFLSLFIAVQFPAFSQQDTISLNTLIAKTAKLSNERPVEKIYLHFDKPYYAVNDTIWFKGYLMLDRRQLSDFSKVLYVEMFSSQDSLVQTLKLPVIDGIALGDITLSPLNYKQGNYRIRAYTNWMRNADPDYFFNKTITIGNLIDNEVLTNINYSHPVKGSDKISANISLRNEDDTPIGDKKITWRIETGFDITSKGKETTDKNGVARLNFPISVFSDSLSSTLITVIDMGNRKTITRSFSLRSAAPAIDVQFFPEGGDLIVGVPSNVAFKAIKSDGLGVDVKGTINDDAGKQVANFATQHTGMGVFSLKPEEGKLYKATITFPNGATQTVDLPKVKSAGMNLAVFQTDTGGLTVKLSANASFYKLNQNKKFYVIGRSGGIVCYAAQTILQSQVYNASVDKDKFPTGITQFTLFAENGQPISERLTFIKHDGQLSLLLKTAKPTYGPLQKVKMDVSASSNKLPVAANLSVAVINETKVPVDENTETTILSDLLLTSDLKGYIEKPNYYFRKENSKAAEDLDLLMLTQGYRRFTYKDILADKFPPIAFIPEQGIEISGTLRTLNGMPVNKGNVSLLIPDKNFGKAVVTDPSGNFRFPDLMFIDSSKVTLNARNNANNKNLMMMLDATKRQLPTVNVQAPDEILNIDSVLRPYLQNSKKQYSFTRMLKEVVIKGAAPRKPSHLDYSSLSGLSMMPDHLLPGERFAGCNVFVNCLQTNAMGLTFLENNFYVTRDYNAGKMVPVQIFLNGIPVDLTSLNGINATEVESVEIFLKDDLGTVNRMYNSNGVIVINTKKIETVKISKQDLMDLFPPKYLLTFSPKGYTMARQFYSPKYDGPKTNTDLRTTIYWNPKVITDKTGATSFEFFNAGEKGTYRAVIEGVDAEGHVARYVYHYKVE